MNIKSTINIFLTAMLLLVMGCGSSMQDDMMVRAKALAEARRADREKEAAEAEQQKKEAAEKETADAEPAKAEVKVAKATPPAAPPKPAIKKTDPVKPQIAKPAPPVAAAAPTPSQDAPSVTMVAASETVSLSAGTPAGLAIPPIPGLMPANAAPGSADDFPAMDFGNDGVASSTTPSFAPAAPDPTGDTPIPPTADVKDASDKLRELFSEQMAAAKTAADRVALGRLLIVQADSLSNDPAALYATLQAARTIGCSAGNLPLAQEADVKIRQVFAVDPEQMQLDMIRRFAGTAYTPHRYVDVNGFGTMATSVLTGAIEKDDYKVASLCCNLIGRMVRLGDQSLTPQASEQLEKYLKIAHNKYKSSVLSMEVLQANPADPEAAAVVGMYFCFVRGNWDEGIRLLRLASDEKLSKAAITDSTATANETPTAMVHAGDAWWAASEHAKDPLLEYFGRGRALHWYRQALPQLGETLDRLRVTGRLKGYSESLDGSLVESIMRVAGSNAPTVDFYTEK
ncbi:hypothetical protein EC9_52520 [Rosistilla ulvae]|uniref:Uncharacterized protein n=1 Tax=Rosistilla ulvae TaxID=1930277 RepID=A0A517M826_9BACT|nr:hypothetical protein EC9_52520 [Rosistilla ulvae]